MHETMVAQSLLATITAEAKKQKARPILAKISCGMLNDVNEEILSFAMEAITKGTRCEGVKIEVDHKPIRGKCNKCKKKFAFEVASPVCSECGSNDFNLLPDEPLVLEEIEFERE